MSTYSQTVPTHHASSHPPQPTPRQGVIDAMWTGSQHLNDAVHALAVDQAGAHGLPQRAFTAELADIRARAHEVLDLHLDCIAHAIRDGHYGDAHLHLVSVAGDEEAGR